MSCKYNAWLAFPVLPALSLERICLLAVLAIATCVETARIEAAVIVTAFESEGTVRFRGGGTLNTDALSGATVSTGGGGVRPNLPVMILSRGTIFTYTSLASGPSRVVGPDSFGDGGIVLATEFEGDPFGVTRSGGEGGRLVLVAPFLYESNTPLSASMTFEGESFESLAIDTGTYVWSWGSGSDFDTLTLNVVPEPSALAGVAWLGLAGITMRRVR